MEGYFWTSEKNSFFASFVDDSKSTCKFVAGGAPSQIDKELDQRKGIQDLKASKEIPISNDIQAKRKSRSAEISSSLLLLS